MTPDSQSMSVNGRLIGLDQPTYFIADIAANHDGNLDRAKQLIRLAATAGADAAKFQHFSADTIVSDKGFRDLGKSLSHQAGWKKSVFDTYKDASIDLSWTLQLKEACDEAGIAFMTSPYSLELVDAVDPYVPAFKIGSGDITWLEIIHHIAGKGKPYFLATGASTLEDVDAAVKIGMRSNSQICIMQCNTNYTASLENFRFIQLGVLETYRKRYPGALFGLSDHTPGYATVLGAISLGARVVEKHFTDDNGRQGPDHAFSMDPESWSSMVVAARQLEQALGHGDKQVELNELDAAIVQRRAIRAARTIEPGSPITREDIVVLRPCPPDGISPAHLDDLVGSITASTIEVGMHIRWSDLA